jgi:hypothetical protein
VSVHVTSWVLRHSKATLGDRLVLLVLADHANDDGTSAWPALATIAHQSRLSERQARRSLRSLEAAGEIHETGKSRKGTHVYELPLYQTWADNMSSLENEAAGDIRDTSGGTSATAAVHDLSPDPSLEQPSIEPPEDQLPRAAAREDLLYDPLKGMRVHVEGIERPQDLAWNALETTTQAVGAVNGKRMRESLATIREVVWEWMLETNGKAVMDEFLQTHVGPPNYERGLARMIERVSAALMDDAPTLTWGPEGIARNFRRGMSLIVDRPDVDEIVRAARAGRAA